MWDRLTWIAALLVLASLTVAVWCGRTSSPSARMAPAELSLVAVPGASAATPELRGISRRPQDAASCTFGEVMLIAAHADPKLSSASVRLLGGATEIRRTGESLDGFVVEAIHWDRVSFRRGNVRCDLHIGDALDGAAPPAEPSPRTRDRRVPTWRARSGVQLTQNVVRRRGERHISML